MTADPRATDPPGHDRAADGGTMKMDLKFHGTIVKNKDNTVVPDDQWLVFLVKDNAVPAMLETYYQECIRLEAGEDQIMGVADLIQRVNDWRAMNNDLCKVPDVQYGELRDD